MASSQHCPSVKAPVQYSHKGNQRGKLRLLVALRKMNTLIAGDYIQTNHSVSTLTDAAQLIDGEDLFSNLIAPKRITAFKWLTNTQSNSLVSIPRIERSHSEDWHKDLVVPYQHFRASSAKISIQSSTPNNMHKTLMILAWLPIPLNN